MPLQIGSSVSARIYNNFIERQESPGYKFELAKDGKLFIVDMASRAHEKVVMRLSHFFHQANGGVVDNPPIKVSNQPRKIFFPF